MVRTVNNNAQAFKLRQEKLQKEMLQGKSMLDIIKEEEQHEYEIITDVEGTLEEANESEEESEDYDLTADKVRLFFKQIAQDNNLSSNMMAKIFDISPTSMQNFMKNGEGDEHIPTFRLLSKVARGLQVPLYECVQIMVQGHRPPLLKIKRKTTKDLFAVTDFTHDNIQSLADNLLSMSKDDRSVALESILTAFQKAQNQSKIDKGIN